jgi:hypothetical protein
MKYCQPNYYYHYFSKIQGDFIMLCKIFRFSSIALLTGLLVLPTLTTSAQAQSQVITLPIEVINISGLERRVGGGHKAKVTYKVTLPEKFKLTRILGKIEFKLSDGNTQKGEFTSNTLKAQDTIEIAARGDLIKVDQTPVSIKASIEASAEKPFNSFTVASFSPNGNLLSQQDGDPNLFPLNTDITRISEFDRQALGGHRVRVHFERPLPNTGFASTPIGYKEKERRVKVTLKLTGNQTQTNTVVKKNQIQMPSSQLVDTDGKIGVDGAAQQIDTQVAIDGVVSVLDVSNRTETCAGNECTQ